MSTTQTLGGVARLKKSASQTLVGTANFINVPLTISSTPSSAPFYGDIPIILAITGAGSTPNHWEATGGSFSDHNAISPSFTPPNKTASVTVTGRRTVWGSGNWVSTGSNLTPSGTIGDLLKSSVSTWSHGSSDVLLPVIVGAQFFVEFSTAETNTEKAGGITDDGSYADPTVATSPKHTNMWHLMSDGTAQPRKDGTTLIGSPVSYSANDIFQVQMIGTDVYYKQNGVVVAHTTQVVSNYYPYFTLKSVGATFKNCLKYADDLSPKYAGTLTLNISGVFPVQPNYTYDLNKDNRTLTSTAEDGSSIYRYKGTGRRTLSLGFNNRPFTEYVQLSDFWDDHKKHIAFYYRDLVMDKVYLMTHDSGLRIQPAGPDQITISVSLKEV